MPKKIEYTQIECTPKKLVVVISLRWHYPNQVIWVETKYSPLSLLQQAPRCYILLYGIVIPVRNFVNPAARRCLLVQIGVLC